MRLHVLAPMLGAIALGCATGGMAGSDDGMSPRGRAPLRREDRVLLSQFNEVTAVAISTRMVYMTTPGGLGIYDRTFASWLPPLTETDGFPQDRVTAIASEQTSDGVWIGTMGAVIYYRPALDIVVRTIIPGIVDRIMFDRRDYSVGAYVHAGGAWTLVSPTGFTTPVDPGRLPPVQFQDVPEGLRQIYQEFPSLQNFERLLTRDDELRTWPVSAGAKAPDRSEVWLGTFGNGIYKVDPLFVQSEHEPFGLLDRGAGALALASDGVWVAGMGNGRLPRGGLTFASTDLQRWRWLEGAMNRPIAGARAWGLDLRERWAWIATEQGVMRMDTRNENDVQIWNATHGLPSDVALAVVARPDGAWIGTARGAILVREVPPESGRGRSRFTMGPVVASGIPVRALLFTGDTLWLGTDAGLLFARTGADTVQAIRPSALSSEPRLSRPVVALARSDTVVAVANADEVLRYDLRAGRLMPRMATVTFQQTGGITTMAMDERALWVGGPLGLWVIQRANETARFHPVASGEIAGPVNDIRLTRDFAWVATSNGVMRLRRNPDGTLP